MSFQAMNLIVEVMLAVTAAFVGLVVLSLPALTVVAARQVIDRRKRNWRDRWARQRVLQQTVAGIAASNRAVTALPVDAYPAPEETKADRSPDAVDTN
jgi:hypothetical protein